MTQDAKGDSEPLERTPDGRYIVVGGRRWRASDPSIPEKLRVELVGELMAARRAVRSDGDRARHRVQDAKIALGERGDPWWEPPTPQGLQTRIAATLRALLRRRDASSSVCPSEVARVVGGAQWRELMPQIRSLAWQFVEDGEVAITQRGTPVGPDATGPIRLARGPKFVEQ